MNVHGLSIAELREPIELGIQYLHRSPIWNLDGSVNAAYVLDHSKYHPKYHEITGYAISMAWLIQDYLQIPSTVGDAQRATKYLLQLGRQMGQEGRFPHAYSHSFRKLQECLFSFDHGIILQALITHRRHIPEDVKLSQLNECALWLVQEMQYPDGSFKAFTDLHGRHMPSSSEFFHDCGSLHAKLAIPLIQMHGLTGHDHFRESAIRVCDWVLKHQDPITGLFWANDRHDHVFSHAHAYAVEGLIYAYHVYGNPAYLHAVRLAAEALARIQSFSGGIPSHPIDHRSAIKRLRLTLSGRVGDTVDATAQAVQIWIFMALLSHEKAFLTNINKACEWLITMQIGKAAKDPAAVGAFRPRAERGIPMIHGETVLETWASQFAVRALILTKTLGEGQLSMDRLMEHWC